MTLPRILRRAADADFDVVTFGENSLDTIVVAGERPGGSKSTASFLAELPGGQAATAAAACARLGWRTRYVGAFGGDHAAAIVHSALTEAGVDIIAVDRGLTPTRRAVILVDPVSHERTVHERRDPALDIHIADVGVDVFANTRVLIVDATDLRMAVHAAGAARAARVRTIVDLDHARPGVAELLRSIDVIVVPEEIVASLSSAADLGRGLATIGREAGAMAVVATLGAEGALGWCAGAEFRVPGVPVEAVDTTGAGDAFRAGLAAAWLGAGDSDPDVRQLLEGANLLGSLNCRAIGALAGLPTRIEVPPFLRGSV